MKRVSKVAYATAFLSLTLAVFIGTCHFFQFDSLSAVTLIPPLLWLVLALFLLLPSIKRPSRNLLVANSIAWLLFTAFFVEEARSLIRFKTLPARPSSELLDSPPESAARTLRVVTLNCNVGSIKAARETLRFSPDIVLLQETPNRQALDAFADELQDRSDASRDHSVTQDSNQVSVLIGGDASIVVCGAIEVVSDDRASHFSHAVVTLGDGKQLDVVSLRLSPPVFRIDFMSAGFWRDHVEKRKHHRVQLQAVVNHLKENARTDDWIVGGDFNLVGGDGALTPFKGFLQDSFLVSGIGWGNTGTSDYPVFRVDQIWATASLRPLVSKAFKTVYSDHRLVVADFRIDNEE